MGGRGASSGRKLFKLRFELNIQNFASKKDESDVYRQSNTSIRRGMRKLEKRVIEHENKIKNPEQYVKDFYQLPKERQEGLIRHWEKEIRTFKLGISLRKLTLSSRGEDDEE